MLADLSDEDDEETSEEVSENQSQEEDESLLWQGLSFLSDSGQILTFSRADG